MMVGVLGLSFTVRFEIRWTVRMSAVEFPATSKEQERVHRKTWAGCGATPTSSRR